MRSPPTATCKRKVKEALLALRVERRFDKEEILEAYLNRIYLGNGHYGVQAAARGYFGKPASQLTVAESALLTGLIPCPSVCSPRIAPAVAESRRDQVLKAMRENGAITPEAYDEALGVADFARRRAAQFVCVRPITMPRRTRSASRMPAACTSWKPSAAQVMQQFGAEDVLKGGLRIYTTVDMTLQRHAEQAIAQRLAQIDKTGGLEGALVALDPHTGEVLALVGGRDFHTSSFNRATQAKRQPGSAFKPLLFAAAIEQGYTPSSVRDGDGHADSDCRRVHGCRPASTKRRAIRCGRR